MNQRQVVMFDISIPERPDIKILDLGADLGPQNRLT